MAFRPGKNKQENYEQEIQKKEEEEKLSEDSLNDSGYDYFRKVEERFRRRSGDISSEISSTGQFIVENDVEGKLTEEDINYESLLVVSDNIERAEVLPPQRFLYEVGL